MLIKSSDGHEMFDDTPSSGRPEASRRMSSSCLVNSWEKLLNVKDHQQQQNTTPFSGREFVRPSPDKVRPHLM